MQLTVGDLHELLGGELRFGAMPPTAGDATLVGPVVTDSREVQPEEVFFGLAGARFHGGQFAEEAFVRGATGVVTSGRHLEPWAGCWSLEVPDAKQALWRLAAWNRSQYAGPLVAVTGSVGKTTTRQMIDAVLGSRLSGTASLRNYNNHIGVPLSLLRLERWHQYGVVELAASAAGEIQSLARLARPTIGIVTRIGEAHLAGFGTQAAVAAAKAELLAELPQDGYAILNADDAWLRHLAAEQNGRIGPAPNIWIGRDCEADVMATDVRSSGGRLSFRVDGQRYQVPIWGRHHLTSALAAIAVGRLLDFDADEIAAALAEFRPVPLRCEVVQAAGATIVNDSYNSSPTAVRAALELLREIDVLGKRIVVAGDLGEMGEAAGDWHRRMGDEVVSLCGADLLIACGQYADDVTTAAAAAGMPRERIIACSRWEETLGVLNGSLESGDVVLVKGARTLGLERIVGSLTARRAAA